MPPQQQSPILRRRRLGIELRKYREAAGLTGDQVIERIGWASASKLSRLENGRSRPELRDVLDLLEIYGVTESERDEVVAIVRGAGDMRSWLRRYPTMTPRQRQYAELEAGCAEIREYSPVIIPGLLQTQEYARVRFTSSQPLNDPDDREAGDAADPDTEVQARLSRQRLLYDEAVPPEYTAIIEAAALGPRAGSAEVMRGQLAHLCKLAELPHVTIRILPQDVVMPGHYLPHTGFSVYRFADPRDPETVAIEGLSLNFMVSERKELNGYKVLFEWLQAAALSADATKSWLADAAGRGSGGAESGARVRGAALPPPQRTPHAGRLTEQ
ncbi:helix-turn-helix domain-containing protein [Plantactinospora siamensis]|uniref:Helix-turn-helix domain-containing protein n=1 Tax=Plantactinospora siamensis TaxID=555372 RepID=A0ABV6NY70_9ACTN